MRARGEYDIECFGACESSEEDVRKKVTSLHLGSNGSLTCSRGPPRHSVTSNSSYRADNLRTT